MNLVTLVLVALGIVASIALLSMLAGNGTSLRTREACQRMVEHSARFISQSKQDANPLFALIDATAAVTHAEDVSMLSSDHNIQLLFKTSPYELLTAAKTQQKLAVKRLCNEYPDLLPTDQENALLSGWI
jgi:hypothetical protein